MAAGFAVKTNEVHGMAQRGGSVLAQIRYGQEVASLERIESLRNADYLAPDGLAVVSSQIVLPVTVSSGQATYPQDAEARIRTAFPRLIYLDAIGIATGIGNARCSNLVILGALAKGLVLPAEAWREGIRQSVKPRFLDINLRAFEAGQAL